MLVSCWDNFSQNLFFEEFLFENFRFKRIFGSKNRLLSIIKKYKRPFSLWRILMLSLCHPLINYNKIIIILASLPHCTWVCIVALMALLILSSHPSRQTKDNLYTENISLILAQQRQPRNNNHINNNNNTTETHTARNEETQIIIIIFNSWQL